MTSSREHGFTLVELLVAIALASIIAGVLGEAVTIGLKTTTATATTFADAGNTRALTSDLLTDVRNADTLGTTAASATAACATAPPETVLWTKDQGAVELYSVTKTGDDATGFSQLTRQPCGGQPAVVAAWLGHTAVPTILCHSSAADDVGSATDCGGVTTPAADPLLAVTGQFDVADATGFPSPGTGGIPPPYEITIGAEAMTVTALAGKTLTVSRPSGQTHTGGPGGDSVTYKPASVSIEVPRASSAVCTSGCGPGDDFNLTITTTGST